MANRPAILFVDQSGDLGGAELALLDIAEDHRDRSRVCLLADGPFAGLLRERGVAVDIIPLTAAGGIRRDDGLSAAVGGLPGLVGVVRRFARAARAHDVVYANTMKAFVVAVLSRPLHRRPVIWHLHDYLSPDHFSGLLRRLVVGLARFGATRIIANSSATAEMLARQGGRPVPEVIYNGIDAGPFDAVDAAEARASLVEETAFRPDLPIVGVFSRLAAWKGQHVLIEALADLPNVQAVIVGSALFGEHDYEARLRGLIAEFGLEGRVQLAGFRKDIPLLVKAVDLVVHTSIAPEPFGRVIVEGMLAAKPVIATRAGGAAELIADKISGLLVAPGDAAALRDAIGLLLTDGPLSERLAAAGYASARKNFTKADMLEKTNDLIAEVVSVSAKDLFRQ